MRTSNALSSILTLCRGPRSPTDVTGIADAEILRQRKFYAGFRHNSYPLRGKPPYRTAMLAAIRESVTCEVLQNST